MSLEKLVHLEAPNKVIMYVDVPTINNTWKVSERSEETEQQLQLPDTKCGQVNMWWR
jgi:hypothetical protein